MTSISNYFKNRASWLNAIRLFLAVTFAGEAINSAQYLLLAVTFLFLYQINLNTICGPDGCEIPKK